MTKVLVEGLAGVLAILTLGAVAAFVVFICKPWRVISFMCSLMVKTSASELDRPLVSNEFETDNQQRGQERIYDLEGAYKQREGLFSSLRSQGDAYNKRVIPSPSNSTQDDSLIVDVVSDPIEDISIGQTLKRPLAPENFVEAPKFSRTKVGSRRLDENDITKECVPKAIAERRSCLSLEVVSGPSSGLRCSIHSTCISKLPLTIGRVSSELIVEDSEVSGRHAMVNWNADKMKWELVDMGSLNGTLLNSKPIGHPDSASRHWGNPVELSTGDVITLGTRSNLNVLVSSQTPFGIGLASDPMAIRRGGKKHAMEDVSYYQWPLPGIDQFGVFGICDGHGGADAAKSASKILPEKVAAILSDSLVRQRVLVQRDASDVLRFAFSQTEASMNSYYEGCTATLLLIWIDGSSNLFAQCANVGDTACFINAKGRQIKLTEDHRITNASEKNRINLTGEPLRDCDTRLCGLNLGRMLGDKFLKQEESRFSSEPYVSPAVLIDQAGSDFALIASDGFWDVVSFRKAVQLIFKARERNFAQGSRSPEMIAKFLLNEAVTLRTRDNTSIIYLDFGSKCKGLIESCVKG